MLRVLGFVAGAAVATAIWWYATPAYDALLCSILQFAGVAAVPVARTVAVTRSAAPSIQVPADQLTYNVILFAGLVAAMPPRVWKGVLAFLVLCAFHVIALYTTIKSTAALGAGSVWNVAEFIYRIGGMFAIAFVCWYTVSHAQIPDRISGKRASRPQ